MVRQCQTLRQQSLQLVADESVDDHLARLRAVLEQESKTEVHRYEKKHSDEVARFQAQLAAKDKILEAKEQEIVRIRSENVQELARKQQEMVRQLEEKDHDIARKLTEQEQKHAKQVEEFKQALAAKDDQAQRDRAQFTAEKQRLQTQLADELATLQQSSDSELQQLRRKLGASEMTVQQLSEALSGQTKAEEQKKQQQQSSESKAYEEMLNERDALEVKLASYETWFGVEWAGYVNAFDSALAAYEERGQEIGRLQSQLTLLQDEGKRLEVRIQTLQQDKQQLVDTHAQEMARVQTETRAEIDKLRLESTKLHQRITDMQLAHLKERKEAAATHWLEKSQAASAYARERKEAAEELAHSQAGMQRLRREMLAIQTRLSGLSDRLVSVQTVWSLPSSSSSSAAISAEQLMASPLPGQSASPSSSSSSLAQGLLAKIVSILVNNSSSIASPASSSTSTSASTSPPTATSKDQKPFDPFLVFSDTVECALRYLHQSIPSPAHEGYPVYFFTDRIRQLAHQIMNEIKIKSERRRRKRRRVTRSQLQ